MAAREVWGADSRAGQEALRILELTPEFVFPQEQLNGPVSTPLLHCADKPGARVIAEQPGDDDDISQCENKSECLPFDGEYQLLEDTGVEEQVGAYHPVQLVLKIQ